MLRLLLRDFKTDSDERFFALLGDFVATYKNRKATSEDFAALAEKHVGRSMDRFFQQWLYGTEVPTIRYDYKIRKDKQGQYWVDLTADQEDVTSPFELDIPVGFVLQGNDEMVQLFSMDDWHAETRMGPFSKQPGKVNFNTFGGVLARVKRQ